MGSINDTSYIIVYRNLNGEVKIEAALNQFEAWQKQKAMFNEMNDFDSITSDEVESKLEIVEAFNNLEKYLYHRMYDDFKEVVIIKILNRWRMSAYTSKILRQESCN